MGLVDDLQGLNVYLDTNIFIYALEGFHESRNELAELFSAVDKGIVQATSSELSLAEALVKPFKDESKEQQEMYLILLQDRPHFRVLPISRLILIEAARLRSSTSLMLPDAIHLATGLKAQTDCILTNDDAFKDNGFLPAVMLSDYI